MSEPSGPLPPGWDSKFDPRTGRYYFINHYTKTTVWEDPRVRYQQIGKSGTTSSGHATSSTTTTTTSGRHSAAPGGVPSSASADLNAAVRSVSSRRVSAGEASHDFKTYPIGNIPAPEAANSTSSHGMLPDRKQITPSSPIGQQHTANLYGFGSLSGGAGTGVQASPLPLQRLQLEESVMGSPMTTRSSVRRESHVLADIGENEMLNTEKTLENISAMFPTVDENHIIDLLKKYHGSQAVVISALQVAKHPFITPGPGTVFTPPPTRHSTLPGASQPAGTTANTTTGSLPHYYSGHNYPGSTTPVIGGRDVASVTSSGYPTPRPGSAASGFDNSCSIGSPQIGQSGILFRSFPKPHSSPKMKLRYLKSVFPTVEEYLLLDVLSNSDNNVQKAADRLVKMGYVKRDTPSAPRLHARKKEEERLAEKRTPLPKPPPLKSEKEKEELRKKMKDKYENKYEIPERILFMALESVFFDEDQANSLIITMIDDDIKRQKSKEMEKAKEREKKAARKSPKPSRKVLEGDRLPRHTSPKHEPKKGPTHGKKGWTSKSNIDLKDGSARTTRGTSTGNESSVKSNLARGPNPDLRKGPNDDLLLTDYVTWNGPDPDLRKGCNTKIARGPNPELCKGSKGSQVMRGPNSSLCKGPQVGLAKGSIYNQIKMADNASSGRGMG